MSFGTRSVAFAHDYMTQIGGAERVAGLFAGRNPDWDLFTSLHREDAVPIDYIGNRPWATSFLQHLPSRVPLKTMLPLLPRAFASFNLSLYETVISSSSAFAHHARKAPGAGHISYCCTPPRFLWHSEEYFRGKPVLRRLLAPLLSSMRHQDLEAASGVDTYIAVSHHIAERIRQTYGKDAFVVPPPVDCERFQPTRERSGRFLVLSRLVPTKRVELVVEAASRYELPLDVIGLGPELPVLRRIAGSTVRFHGWQSDHDVRRAVAESAAVIVAGEEDFGLVMAEAQAAGRPPIAFGRGGAREIIEDGVTGFLFHEQTADAIATAMIRSQRKELNAADLRASAERFDAPRFWRDFDDTLAQAGAGPGRLAEAGVLKP